MSIQTLLGGGSVAKSSDTSRPRRRLCSLSILLLVMASLAQIDVSAEVITIDFAGTVPGSLYGFNEPGDYLEDGFLLSVVRGHYDVPDTFDGDQYINIDTFAGGYSTIRLESFGNSFDLLGFDLLYWWPRPDGQPLDEVAFMTSSAGGYIDVTDAGAPSYGSEWRNITWIEFSVLDPNHDTSQDNLGIDNIRFAVPEPTPLTLLGFGAIAVCAVRLRKRLRGF
jgi:hypothetical protein